jgi:hypothetical protein
MTNTWLTRARQVIERQVYQVAARAPAAGNVRVDFEVPTLADAERYGSKLVAALDRQRPRDIFDGQHMYDTYGLREAFSALDCGNDYS